MFAHVTLCDYRVVALMFTAVMIVAGAAAGICVGIDDCVAAAAAAALTARIATIAYAQTNIAAAFIIVVVAVATAAVAGG